MACLQWRSVNNFKRSDLARAGRKRNPTAKREPSGRIARAEYENPQSAVLAQRRKVAITAGIGLSARPLNSKDAIKSTKLDKAVLLDQKMSTALGRACKVGKITECEYQAGERFLQAYTRMAQVSGWPSPHVKAVDLGASQGLSLKGELRQDKIDAAKRAWRDIRAFLLSGLPGAIHVLDEFIVLDRPLESAAGMGLAKKALARLADYWGVGRE